MTPGASAEAHPDASHPQRRRGRTLISAAAVFFGSVILAVSVYFLAIHTSAPENFGTIQRAGPGTVSTTSNSPKATASERASRLPTVAAGPPAWLDLPTIHIRARVENVVTTHGILAVPDDPAKVGWWTGSALPGTTTGSTVLDGHVDSAQTGT